MKSDLIDRRCTVPCLECLGRCELLNLAGQLLPRQICYRNNCSENVPPMLPYYSQENLVILLHSVKSIFQYPTTLLNQDNFVVLSEIVVSKCQYTAILLDCCEDDFVILSQLSMAH